MFSIRSMFLVSSKEAYITTVWEEPLQSAIPQPVFAVQIFAVPNKQALHSLTQRHMARFYKRDPFLFSTHVWPKCLLNVTSGKLLTPWACHTSGKWLFADVKVQLCKTPTSGNLRGDNKWIRYMSYSHLENTFLTHFKCLSTGVLQDSIVVSKHTLLISIFILLPHEIL